MIRQQQEVKRKMRPVLDNQEVEQIHRVLSESFHNHRRIALKLFDKFANVEISRFVTTIQTYRKEIKLTTFQVRSDVAR
ncbi:YolD-like family protein [Paenibacillus sp. D2_2]|uniref:YolD-like family protein n=1 Tax=Paenibacillus sp. D2_2 TaxID=3073092 RepID=UPI0028149C7B|nr:YolD-like family protein [Paenibacillus sp. D2_2]WMT38888.1 YolD-like family protein [Paenibacillus sp. D2_2]